MSCPTQILVEFSLRSMDRENGNRGQNFGPETLKEPGGWGRIEAGRVRSTAWAFLKPLDCGEHALLFNAYLSPLYLP